MSGDVTIQSLKRLSRIPDSDNPATLIAGQEYDNVEIVGGTIDGTNIGQNNAGQGTFDSLSAHDATVSSFIQCNSYQTSGASAMGANFVTTNALSSETFLLSAAGTVIVNGVTPVVHADTNITANSNVLFTLKTLGGTQGAMPTVTAKSAGVSFTVKATALDSSTYNYIIIN